MSIVENYINEQRILLLKRQRELIEKYPARYYFDLLFDLATIFEEFYVDQHDDRGRLQEGSVALANLSFAILLQKQFIEDKRVVDKIQNKWYAKIQKQAKKSGRQNNTLTELLHTSLALSELDEYEDIEKNDSSRKLRLQDTGLQVEVLYQDLIDIEKVTQQKYPFEIAYYVNYGRQLAPHWIKEAKIILPGKTDLDVEASFGIISWEIATTEYLAHYGIEETFSWHGNTYQTILIVRILAFFVEYYKSRYGTSFEMNIHRDASTVPSAIYKSMEELGIETGEPLGPFVLLDQKNMVKRLHKIFRSTTPKPEIEKHLVFFTVHINKKLEKLSLLHTPFLCQGDKTAIFLRPLMWQNPWIPIVQRLIGNKKEEASVTIATNRLKDLFKKREFSVLADEVIYQEDGKTPLTDIDMAALKDKHLFLFQLKMTPPRSHAQLYKSHVKDALTKAYRQNRKVFNYLSENWIEFRHKLDTDIAWNELQIHRIVLSTSFEADRSEKIKESIKISQFELERYLMNNARLLIDDDMEEIPKVLQYPFYEEGELTGDRLWELIESNTLWSFLDKKE